jgi:glycosyltransferase involved in cell wall biosynthesis
VPSRFTRDELVREGFDPERIHHVPLAVRPPEPASVRLSREPLRRSGVTGPYLLAVGTIEPRKDHASIVAAFERLRTRRPELSLVVVGASGWLPAKTAPPLARPGVVECGHVSDAELDALYRHAEVVVNASVYEGFGLTVLEALTRGCAVVASRIPAHVELVGDGARLFPPGDVSALAAETDGLLRDPNARAELAQAALHRSSSFSISAMIAGHLATYAAVGRL